MMFVVWKWIAIVFIFPLTALPQEDRKKDDILVPKKGSFIVGKIVELGRDSLRIEVEGDLTPRLVALKDLDPTCVVRLRLERINRHDPGAYFELGTFCFENGLLKLALQEYRESHALDRSQSDNKKKARAMSRESERKVLLGSVQALTSNGHFHTAWEFFELLSDQGDAPQTPDLEKLETELAKGIPRTLEEAFDKGFSLYKDAEAAGVTLETENPFRRWPEPLTHGAAKRVKYSHLFYLPAPADLLISQDGLIFLKERASSKEPEVVRFAHACLNVMQSQDRLREPGYELLPAPLKGEAIVYYLK